MKPFKRKEEKKESQTARVRPARCSRDATCMHVRVRMRAAVRAACKPCKPCNVETRDRDSKMVLGSGGSGGTWRPFCACATLLLQLGGASEVPSLAVKLRDDVGHSHWPLPPPLSDGGAGLKTEVNCSRVAVAGSGARARRRLAPGLRRRQNEPSRKQLYA